MILHVHYPFNLFLHKGTNIIKESIKTFSNADGSDKQGDIIVKTKEEALKIIQDLVAKKQDEAGALKKEKRKVKMTAVWNFRTSPHEEFGKTLDDLFMAFVVWAKVKEDDDKSDGEEQFNASKAFRRLVSY